MKNIKSIIALIAAVIVTMSVSGSVQAAPAQAAPVQTVSAPAAPIQMADGNFFDAEFYAASYPDVVAAFGTDPQMLYTHYLLCGAAEGRLPYAGETDSSDTLVSVDNYAASRLSVFSSMVVNGKAYEDYKVTQQSSACTRIENGYCWQRWNYSVNVATNEAALFDAASYAALNPDIAAECGYSAEALWNHYKTTGVYEGRPVMATTARANAKLAIIQVAQSIITPGMTTEQKIHAVHDWMCANCYYDRSFGNRSYYIDGFMTNGTAVCNGYAETFEYFMYALGIPCQTIWGGNHAWNIVCVDGQWLCIDVCWDDCLSRTGISYKYYLISQEQMCRDHYIENYKDFF